MSKASNGKKDLFYTMPTSEVLKELEVTTTGLTTSEAKKRQAHYGLNALTEGKKKSLLVKFGDQFKDFMIVILLIAAVISGVVGKELTDALVILLVVIVNAIFGVIQEAKAEQAIEALKEMASPSAKVKRDGHVTTVKSDELVPGDIILLEAGDVIPADLRLLEAASLKIEEAALTGESVPVEKSATVLTNSEVGLGDRVNMAFMTANVTYGRGVGVVVATGMATEVGKIADMLAKSDETKTPLKENLNQLGKVLTIAILVICALMFGVGLLRGNEPLEMLLTAISLAVAAIPEGLPAIVTIILALGTQKLAKRNAIVRKLPAVETLGSTDIICSDKTGTLTLNKMTVEGLYTTGKLYLAKEGFSKEDLAVKVMTYCNDTKMAKDGTLIGDPTETAMIQYALDHDYPLLDALQKEPRIAELPFDSERKLMTTIHPLENGKYFVAVKGAPDVLLARCDYLTPTEKLTAATKEEILANNTKMAKKAWRVLAMAYQIVDEVPELLTSEVVENHLIFAGLVGMIDPERKEAKAAVEVAKEAGIRPIMITGDHKETAEAIALRLGIITGNETDAVLTGAQLNELTEAEFAKKVTQYSVYARVSPEHKVRIVNAWKKEGKVVAMTGDGVNDAPALKAADIGIGMGITGTEVSKGASDMILGDDNFSTIIVAVEEGRKVFSNIQKAIQYLMSCNIGEVLTLFIATMLGWDTLLPVHLLWINLVTDTFPAIALGLEPAEKDVMKHLPRGRGSNFFSGGVFSSIIYQGILQGGLTLLIYQLALVFPEHQSYQEIHGDALTMAFATLGLIQLFHAFNVKSIHQSLFKVGLFKNKAFNLAVVVSFTLLAATIVIPGFNTIFRVSHLSFSQWGLVLGTAFSIIPIVEFVKVFQRKFNSKIN